MIERLFQQWADLCHKDLSCVVAEWHSFWIGFSEAFCFFIKPQFKPTVYAKDEMKNEWHYYRIGNAVGICAWVLIATSVIRMFL